jgi:hypothetical protein
MAMTMTREEVDSQCGWETLCFTVAVQLFAWQRMGVAGLITLRAGILTTERQRPPRHDPSRAQIRARRPSSSHGAHES